MKSSYPLLQLCLQIALAITLGLTLTRSARAETLAVDSVLIRLINQAEVPARAIGSLTEIHVSEGTVVTQGQLLGQIDQTEAELDYKRAQYELEIAQQEAEDDVAIRSAMKTWEYSKSHYDRLLRADQVRPNSVSQSELEKARLDAEQAEFEMEKGKNELNNAKTRLKLTANALALAQRNLEVRKILAPQSGVVVDVMRHAGEWVKPGEPIFRIVDTKRLRAEGFVQASAVVKKLEGAAVKVVPIFEETTSLSFDGKVVFVSPEIDPVNGQIRVIAEIENPQGLLSPGLRGKMSISAD